MSSPPVIWVNVLFFTVTAVITVVGVPLYTWLVGFDAWQLFLALLLLVYSGMSITMGYHRLWSHRAFDAHPVVRFALAIGGALAIQNSILHWSSDHREHHRFVDDKRRDPYAATRGFWYSHIGWMLKEYQADRYRDYGNVQDLAADPIVRWQHKYYWALAWICNLAFTLVLGLLHGDILGAVILIGFARITLGHHFTFFINSLAHIWGSQPYSDQNTAKDNGVLAFLTYGEGYHNFHHRFASDYRNGIRWWQFDPTKWAIKLLSWIGLTKNLRSYTDERIERARAQLQLNHACSRFECLSNKEELLEKIQWEYDSLLARMHEFYEAKKAVIEGKKSAISPAEIKKVREQYKRLKQAWLQQRKQWRLVLALSL